jgi:phospholipase D1/2
MVVIDHKYGFMGGLDLCFGRMDTKEHHLFDMDYEETLGT